MCGIVGYIGNEDCLPILINGLQKLEYRGYDSAGVALLGNNELNIIKAKGKLINLQEKLAATNQQRANVGIGHTRWATHGIPSEDNAHPHSCCASKIALVHNGILENHNELRTNLIQKGHTFTSQTDTEVLAHLIEDEINKGKTFIDAVSSSLSKIKGSFAIAVMNSDDPQTLVAARKDSPLIIGYGEGENFIASDIPAILNKTRKIQILEDHQIAIVKANSIDVINMNGKKSSTNNIIDVTWDLEAAEKSGYADFMLKEINEQPKAIRETLRTYINNNEVTIDSLGLSDEELKKFERIFILACGTSYHAGWVGKLVIQQWAKIPVEIDISSEFRYRFPIIQPNTLVVAVTQSGETADTLAGVKEAKKRGYTVVSVTNVLGSTITRETTGSLITQAGPEIGVAATKTFTTQLIAFYLLALKLAKAKSSLADSDAKMIISELLRLPEVAEKVLQQNDYIRDLAQDYYEKPNFLFLGRGAGLPIALEGALKLKEISYIHAEGCAAGEMKHGPIALIDKNCPVVAIANRCATYSKVCSNIEEVKARDADVIAVITDGDESLKNRVHHYIEVPAATEPLSPVSTIIPLQLLSYFIAKAKGLNVDQPRNLAKSVTVE